MAGRRYLICYDICDPKRLRRVAKALQSFGTRIQYSVFECRLDSLQLSQVERELAAIIEGNEDQVLFVSLSDRTTNNEDIIISSLGLPYLRRSLVSII